MFTQRPHGLVPVMAHECNAGLHPSWTTFVQCLCCSRLWATLCASCACHTVTFRCSCYDICRTSLFQHALFANRWQLSRFLSCLHNCWQCFLSCSTSVFSVASFVNLACSFLTCSAAALAVALLDSTGDFPSQLRLNAVAHIHSIACIAATCMSTWASSCM